MKDRDFTDAGTPAEAEAANNKASELLIKHNLDSAVVSSMGDAKAGKREEMMVEGGFYAFQRELWKDVAELHFCHYWNQPYTRQKRGQDRISRRHALIGRMVNVRMAIAMATYLQDAIERILSERLATNFENRMSNWAYSFRKGAAHTIRTKLRERRRERLQAEAEEQRKQAAMAETASSGTSVTLAAYSKGEEEANYDFKHGEGAAAKRSAQRAAEAGVRKRMESAYTQWAKNNPQEARSKFQFHDEATKQVWIFGKSSVGGGKGSRGGSDGIDYGGFKAGRELADSIGLDPQAEESKREMIK